MQGRLPNAENARIDSRKLRDYVLNPEHNTGRYKAAFFAQMGYAATDWQLLERHIREQHLAQPEEWVDMAIQLKILDTVIATVNFSEHKVLAVVLGAIVEIYTTPHLAYEVEFVNPDGSTRALLTLAPDQVRCLLPADVLTTRQIALAA